MRHIRKSVVDLTLADLRAFPAWEFALDEEDVEGQDETTVRPCEHAGELDFRCGIIQPTRAHIDADYRRLGKTRGAEVFPVSFRSVPPVADGPITGTVLGYMIYVDLASRNVRLQQ